MNADRPCGIDMGDFLPEKFRMMSTNHSEDSYCGKGGNDGSRFSSYKGYVHEVSESEVTSSILKAHQGIMAALTTRGRNLEIIHKMWTNKDAKTGRF
jgi:hypothetical protein